MGEHEGEEEVLTELWLIGDSAWRRWLHGEVVGAEEGDGAGVIGGASNGTVAWRRGRVHG